MLWMSSRRRARQEFEQFSFLFSCRRSMGYTSVAMATGILTFDSQWELARFEERSDDGETILMSGDRKCKFDFRKDLDQVISGLPEEVQESLV